MTLVLSLITPDVAIQVSDRKLVWLTPDGSIRRENDERNKAVLWCSRLAFAYTGLAELGTERRTDLWLAKCLGEVETRGKVHGSNAPDQADLLVGLAERAGEYFRGARIRRLSSEIRRHAFVAVGWARFDGSSDFEPYFARVSNFHGPNGDELNEAQPTFGLSIRRLKADEGGYVVEVGQPLTRAERDQLAKDLSEVDRNPMAMVAVLSDEVRGFADRTRSVGRGLMANVLPRSSIRPGSEEHVMLLGAPEPGQQTFMYLPPDDREPTTFYGPIHVCGGNILSDFRVDAL